MLNNIITDLKNLEGQLVGKGSYFEHVYTNEAPIDATEENFEGTLRYFIQLANQFKKDLSQEGISIGINEGLLII